MLRRILIFFIFVVIGLWFQGTALYSISPSPSFIIPDLILILVVFIGLNIRGGVGVFISFFLGLLADFSSSQYVGPLAASMVASYYFVYAVSGRLFSETNVALSVLTFFATVIKSIMCLTIMYPYIDFSIFSEQILKIIGLESLYNAILSPFIIALLGKASSSSKSSISLTKY